MLDLFITKRTDSRRLRVLKISENMNVEEVDHYPWFVALDVIDHHKIVKADWLPDVEFYSLDTSKMVYTKRRRGVYKIFTEHPSDVGNLVKIFKKNAIKVSLGNIRYKARVSLDVLDNFFGIKVPLCLHYSYSDLESIFEEVLEKIKNLRVCAFDIEVRAEGSFPKLGSEVFLISCVESTLDPSDEGEVYVFEGSEVLDFPSHLEKLRAHYLIGFNSNYFDIPYLTAYVKDLEGKLITEGYISGSKVVPHVDIGDILFRHGSSFGLKHGSRQALDDIASELGLASKEELEIESSIDRNKIWIEYQRNPSRVRKYSEVDARLTARVGKNVLQTLILLYTLTGISPSTFQVLPSQGALGEYSLTDYLLRKYNIVLELRSSLYETKELDSEIGFYRRGIKVFVPSSGYYKNVAEYDFHMLYPTIYYSDKVDPLTIKICKALGFRVPVCEVEQVSKSVKRIKEVRDYIIEFRGGSYVHEWLSWFYKAREVSKKLKKQLGLEIPDQAIKIVANACYGIFGKDRGNGVHELVSGYIFFKANQVIHRVRGFVEQVLNKKVIYSDTDSLFIVLDESEDPNLIEQEINNFIQSAIGVNYSVKLEDVFTDLVIHKAKNYVGITRDGKVVIKGIERFEMSQVIRENLDDIVKEIISGKSVREVIEKYLTLAPLFQLFIKTSKRLIDLIDEQTNKFKRVTHPRTKAVVLKYLIDYHGVNLNNNQGVSKEFVITRRDVEDVTVIAYYLKSTRLGYQSTILYVEDIDDDRVRAVEGIITNQYEDRGKLHLSVRFIPRELTRAEVISYAIKSSQTIIKFLLKIEEIMSKHKKRGILAYITN